MIHLSMLALLFSQAPTTSRVVIPEASTGKAVKAGDSVNNAVRVNVVTSASVPVSGSVSVSNFPATQPVSGTVTANAGTNLNTSALALDATLTNGNLRGTVNANAGTNLNTSTLALEAGGHLASVDTKTVLPTALDGSGFMKIHEQGTASVSGTFWQATQPVIGTVAVTGTGPSGAALAPATTQQGAVYVMSLTPPLSPFLQRCNAVRRSNCQP